MAAPIRTVPWTYLVGSHAEEVASALRRRRHEDWQRCEAKVAEGGILAAAMTGGLAPALLWERLRSLPFERLAGETIVNHLLGVEALVVKSRLDALMTRPSDRDFYPETRVLRDANDCVLFLRRCAVAVAVAVLVRYVERVDDKEAEQDDASLIVAACARVARDGVRVGDAAWTTIFQGGGRAASLLATIGGRGNGATLALAREALRNLPDVRAAARLDMWILKGDGRANGAGIDVAFSLQDVVDHVASRASALPVDATVAQRYLDGPLLDGRGHKVDFRVWALVTSVEPLVVYGFSDGYARHASLPWATEPESARDALRRHTTNQRWATEILQTSTRAFCGDGAYRTVVEPAFRTICVDVLRRARPSLRRVGRGFELFGFDFLLRAEDDFKTPWLLEVNTSPLLVPQTELTAAMMPSMLDDLFALLLDEPPVPGGALRGNRHRPDLFPYPGHVQDEPPDARDAWHLWALEPGAGDDARPTPPAAPSRDPPPDAAERDWLRNAMADRVRRSAQGD